MTEEQRYDVVGTEPGFELRQYHRHVVAQVQVDGSFEDAGNAAFRPLVGYIGGQNADSQKMAMTAPVIQERAEAVTDGAQESSVVPSGPGRFVVSFVLPADADAEAVPGPSDERVRVRVVPPELAAVARYSGRWTASSYETQVEQLLEAVSAAGFEVVGPARFARFDPPWTPWFRRRNEVVVPVRRA